MLFEHIQTAITAAEKSHPAKLRVVVAGHSMGAALAQLAAVDVGLSFQTTTNQIIGIDVVGFGSPRVGNTAFTHMLRGGGLINTVTLVANTEDVVTNFPLAVQPQTKHDSKPMLYSHPEGALHFFTTNKGSWFQNHEMQLYKDYVVKQMVCVGDHVVN